MKNRTINLLQKLVRINSVYPSEFKLTQFIEAFFKKNHYLTTRQLVEKNRYNLVVEKGTGKKSILLYCHLDTIAPVIGWKSNPFQLKVDKDKVFGLGAWDMKGGVVANISAFLDFEPKNYKLKLAFCVDEENISKGGHALAKNEFMKDVDCIVSTEPSFFYENRGIVIGRPGRAVYQIEITGKPNHYALYDKTIDINFFASGFIDQLQSLYKNRGDKKQFVFVRKILSEAVGMSTPNKIMLELDSSIIPPNTSLQLKKQLENIGKKVNSKFDNYFHFQINFVKRETPFLEGYELKKNNSYLKILEKSVYKITGKKSVPYFRSSIADENIFGHLGKTVLGIGPVGGNAHAPNEWVSLESLRKLYNIINDFLIAVDKSYDLG